MVDREIVTNKIASHLLNNSSALFLSILDLIYNLIKQCLSINELQHDPNGAVLVETFVERHDVMMLQRPPDINFVVNLFLIKIIILSLKSFDRECLARGSFNAFEDFCKGALCNEVLHFEVSTKRLLVNAVHVPTSIQSCKRYRIP